ncbi:expressed unknown protein [Seminavis robusta]|uniref:Uncharacterized protein n=1 Tax=Seminavis robusta TaxID=568900 RepID=A0A9N8DZB1_9STRA|nr:expressed unknown protein [Seminavis robusta]|eukprot:Sro496_g154631.1  (186) ;mRNA; r:51471-52028
MRIATSPWFSKWLQSVNRYPFNELRVTRQGFNCKYVICGYNSDEEDNFCLATISMEVTVLEELILQGACKPLPPAMTDIMDYMLASGLQKSPKWYRAVISTLSDMLESPSPHPCERKDILIECIYWLVRERVSESYELSSLEGQSVMDAWHYYCCHWIDYNKKISFKKCTEMSETMVVDFIGNDM